MTEELSLEERCRRVELLLCDVDGVLTDAHVLLDAHGGELQRFHIRDGMGIRIWERAGYRFGILSLRSSQAVRIRAAELGVTLIRQRVENKLVAAREVAEQLNLRLEQVGYVGDDLPDLCVIQSVGLGVAVADAVAEVRQHAHYVTQAKGGHGAVREVIEMILRNKQRWQALIEAYFV